jgi:hypothetical protein
MLSNIGNLGSRFFRAIARLWLTSNRHALSTEALNLAEKSYAGIV